MVGGAVAGQLCGAARCNFWKSPTVLPSRGGTVALIGDTPPSTAWRFPSSVWATSRPAERGKRPWWPGWPAGFVTKDIAIRQHPGFDHGMIRTAKTGIGHVYQYPFIVEFRYGHIFNDQPFPFIHTIINDFIELEARIIIPAALAVGVQVAQPDFLVTEKMPILIRTVPGILLSFTTGLSRTTSISKKLWQRMDINSRPKPIQR